MAVEDFVQRRSEKLIGDLEAARAARDQLDSATQRERARAVQDAVIHRSEASSLRIFAAAVELEVDALCNDDRTSEACDRAKAAQKHVKRKRGDDHAWNVVRRVHLTAKELDGQLDDAMRGFYALNLRHREPRTREQQLERLRVLRHVLSCAKGMPDDESTRRFVAKATEDGGRLAEELADDFPADVACFLHVAGYTEMRRLGRGGDADRAVELLERSLASRPDTLRDRQSRGMGEGERLLALGERERAIELFARTVKGFAGLLPRHHDSGWRMLFERGLA